MKTYALGITLVGILWVLSMYWMISGMDAITERVPVSPIGTVVGTALLFAGPILLICGPILLLVGFYSKVGAGLTLLGCVILTVWATYVTTGLRSVSWVEEKPLFVICAVLIVVTLLCDLAAIRLYQLVSTNTSKLVG